MVALVVVVVPAVSPFYFVFLVSLVLHVLVVAHVLVVLVVAHVLVVPDSFLRETMAP
ncbi:hypothetical protein EDD64_10534 [Effusibacillus lacus]|nr:hypothetical protein EDD64_10534 [Effusibacillus lacus]